MELLRNTFIEAINDIRSILLTKVDKKTTINNKSLASNIVITKYDIGLGNVDNTPDTTITSQVQELIANKLETIHVNGKTVDIYNNDITLAKQDIQGLDQVNNTSDINKPVSQAQQLAIDAKANKTLTINGYPLSASFSLTKNDIGLDQLNNTSDLNKPVSTAVQIQLDNLNSTLNSASTTIGNLANTVQSSVPITRTINGYPLSSNVTLVKNDLQGLDQVDNTADINKPVSNPVRTELNIIKELNMLALEMFIRPVFDSLTMLQFNEVTVYGSASQPSSWFYNSQLYTRLAFSDGNYGLVYLPDVNDFQKYTFIYYINVASWGVTIPKERSDQAADVIVPNNRVAVLVNDKVNWRYLGMFDYII